jgi:replication factor A1
MSFMPISELSSYRSGWTIKARVLSRSATRTFNRATGSGGKVFDCLLADMKSVEIRASFWDQAVEKFDFLKEGGVFTFSRGQVKLANKRYNTTKHNYELSFAGDAQVAPVEDDVDFVNFQEAYQFVELRELRSLPVPATVDLCVMVKEQMQPKELQGKNRWMRRLTCVDASAHSMDVTLFDEERLENDLTGCCIVVKRCRIGDYRGRDGTASTKQIKVNPESPEAVSLKAWWTSEGSKAAVQGLSTAPVGGGADVPTIEGSFEDLQAHTSKLQVDQSVMFTTQAYLSKVRTDKKGGEKLQLTYDACPNCNKKVSLDQQCLKCDKVVQPNPRYVLTSLLFEDKYAAQWGAAFDEAGRVLLGMKPEEVKAMADHPDLAGKLNRTCFAQPFTLRIKTRCETYEGTARNKSTVVSAEPVNYTELGQKLLVQLQEMYGALGPDAQAEVKELLNGQSSLKAVNSGESFPESWATDFSKLQAVVA